MSNYDAADHLHMAQNTGSKLPTEIWRSFNNNELRFSNMQLNWNAITLKKFTFLPSNSCINLRPVANCLGYCYVMIVILTLWGMGPGYTVSIPLASYFDHNKMVILQYHHLHGDTWLWLAERLRVSSINDKKYIFIKALRCNVSSAYWQNLCLIRYIE